MEDDFYVHLGARIRDRRKGRLTQEALAQRLGLNRTTVVNIERGRQRLAVHQLVEVASVLGCDPADLLDTTADDSDATPGGVFVARIRAKAEHERSGE